VEYEAFIDMVCEEIGIDRSRIRDDTSFLDDLGIDSLTLANFIIKLERKFALRIELSTVWDLKNVKDAYDKFQRALVVKNTNIVQTINIALPLPGESLS
jgi:acyl carrier protein